VPITSSATSTSRSPKCRIILRPFRRPDTQATESDWRPSD
jgi:hypothetical protein